MFNKILISKKNLINNVKIIKSQNKNSLVCAMVKANAYGVGAKQVVKIINNYVDFFGVASVEEAKKVRRYTNKKILIVGPFKLGDESFSHTLTCLEDVYKAIKVGKNLKVHLKVNTGMNRYGFSSLKNFYLALKLIKNSNLTLEGVFTHFPTADLLVKKQTNRFNKFVNLTKFLGFNPIVHADNSEVNLCNNHHFDMVRVGYNLYLNNNKPFKPVVSIYSKIAQTRTVNSGGLVGYNYRHVANKKTRVAIVPLGYADGIDMRLIGFNLLIFGVECKILNICMDCFMLDITNANVNKKDVVPILDKHNTLLKYANYLHTHCYEVSTKFSALRGERVIT